MTGRSLRVRPATLGDAPAVAALVHSAYRSDESRTGWTTEADLVGGQRADATMVAELVAQPGSVVLVAEEDTDDGAGLVACCHLERHGDDVHLGMFAVRPALQGSGLGRRMLDEADRVAAAWGASGLGISVLDRRAELIAWYERCGFVATGDAEPFPADHERFGLPRVPGLLLIGMRRPVRPHPAG